MLNQKKYSKILIIAIFLFSLLVLTLFLILLLSFFFFTFSSGSDSSSDPFHYQYMETNIPKNTTKYGFVEMTRNLGEEEFISYRNEATESFVVISHFGSKKYECTGSCSCEKSDDRRSTTILTRSLFLVLSALSSTVALNIAKEAFQDSCHTLAEKRYYADDCDPTDAKNIDLTCRELFEIDKKSDKFGRTEYSSSVYWEYFCKGYCVNNYRLKNAEAWKVYEKQYDNKECKKNIYCNEVLVKANHRTPYECDQEARRKFRKFHIRRFCKKVSAVEYRVAGKLRKVHACTSSQKKGEKMNFMCVKQGEERPELYDWHPDAGGR